MDDSRSDEQELVDEAHLLLAEWEGVHTGPHRMIATGDTLSLADRLASVSVRLRDTAMTRQATESGYADHLKELYRKGSARTRAAVLGNPACPTALFGRAIEDAHDSLIDFGRGDMNRHDCADRTIVTVRAAGNPAFPPGTLDDLLAFAEELFDWDAPFPELGRTILLRVAGNPATPAVVLESLVDPDYKPVMDALAGNPGCPEHIRSFAAIAQR